MWHLGEIGCEREKKNTSQQCASRCCRFSLISPTRSGAKKAAFSREQRRCWSADTAEGAWGAGSSDHSVGGRSCMMMPSARRDMLVTKWRERRRLAGSARGRKSEVGGATPHAIADGAPEGDAEDAAAPFASRIRFGRVLG